MLQHINRALISKSGCDGNLVVFRFADFKQTQLEYQAHGRESSFPLNVWVAAYFHSSFSERVGGQTYMFSSEEERTVFRFLIDLERIGPAKALGILDKTGFDPMMICLKNADKASFCSLGSLGGKVGEQVWTAFEAAGYVAKAPTGLAEQKPDEGLPRDVEKDILSGLSVLGFKVVDGRDRIKKVLSTGVKINSVSEGIRLCLKSQ